MMMRGDNRVLALAIIAMVLAWNTVATRADEWRVDAPPVWPDNGPQVGSPVRPSVPAALACPVESVAVSPPYETRSPGGAEWFSVSRQSEITATEPLLSPATAVAARRARRTMLAGILGCPPATFQVSETHERPVASARRAGRTILAGVLGCPAEAFQVSSQPAYLSEDLAVDGQISPYSQGTGEVTYGDRTWELLEQPWYNTPAAYPYGRETEVRFGWWGVTTDGDLTKVGEFQDLKSSPFADIHQLASDGVRTVDLFANAIDNRAGQAGLYFFGPRLTADVDYQRYHRRLDHDPLSNFSAPGSGDPVVVDDLNAGEDYAIRVQQLKTYVKGRITKNIKYRVNFWLQRKNGDRQAMGSQHCAGGVHPGNNANAACHVLGQTQRIDWLTMKVEPVVEGRWGPVTVEYSRPMRSFGQNDQIVTRQYGDFFIYGFSGDRPYAYVPESFKQTDRLKLGVDLTRNTRMYSTMHTGNTRNEFRKTDRRFYGADLRLTNHRWDELTLTAYARMNRQLNEFPPFFVDPEGQAMSPTYVSGFLPAPTFQPSAVVPRYGMRHPVDYSRWATGVEANCRPGTWTEFAEGLSISASCEYGEIHRDYAEYFVEQGAFVLDQQYTNHLSYTAGLNRRWSPRFQTFVRYKGRFTYKPLYGVDLFAGESNTNLPENENLVEIGGTWAPATHFIANVTAGIHNRSHSSAIAEFEEDDYPITCTLFYAPTNRLSFNAGYGRYSNWIDQDILFPGDNPAVDRWDRRRWNYGGLSQVLSVGTGFAWNPRVTFAGGLEYVWAHNAIDPLAPWPDLPEYFDVVVDTTRYNAGVDWWLGYGITAYFRYVFEDYEDSSVDYNSGTAHMFLTGASAVY